MACPDCFSGSLSRDEKPIGSEITIHGLQTYVTRPQATPKGLIVILPDAFGWNTPNIRVLADRYSAGGDFLVYVPDFMRGRSCPIVVSSYMERLMTPASWFDTFFKKPVYALKCAASFIPWLWFTRPSAAKPIIFDFFRKLRTSPETSSFKVGVAGFCWGGKYTVLLCHDSPSSRVHRPDSQGGQLQRLVDAGFTAHPSFLKVPEDIDDVRVPLSIAIGEADIAMKLEAVEKAKTILEKKKDGDHEVVIVPGAKHGFAVRGLLSDPKQKEHGDIAEQQAIAWFGRFLA